MRLCKWTFVIFVTALLLDFTSFNSASWAKTVTEPIVGEDPIQAGEQVRHYRNNVRVEVVSNQGSTNIAWLHRPLVAMDRMGADSDDVTTKHIIDFVKPADALQLVGDSESLFVPESHHNCQWTFANGILTASPKWDSVVTPGAYRDFRMHLEFNVNDAGGMLRDRNGNSGVYIQQRYELQILNSYDVSETDYRKSDCGCIYGVKKPDKLVSKPAGQWQSFDIAFRAARFQAGQKIEDARITVFQNGELIHDDVLLKRHTGAGKKEENSARPIKLQGHHNQVQFRNVWIQKLLLDGKQDVSESIPEITASQKTLPLPGESFKINGNDAFVILPKDARNQSDIPWVWYAPTLNGLPAKAEKWMFDRFLAAGVAIAGIDVGESYGSPIGRAKFSGFYDYLVESRKFNLKPCLLARSRGGLMLYNWAAENPQKVSGIAGIYPVCNIASYPGIENACVAFELTAEQLTSELAKHNPINRLAGLAEAKVPIFHLHGDRDQVVPLEENSSIVAKRYKEFGGEMTLEIVEGQGHNMWSGWFQSESLVEFVLISLGREPRTIVAPKKDYSLDPLPNIIIIYADDLGYGDLSCYNPESAYKTPRLDQMAREGIRFTDAHSPSTICSPSRYGLFSGQQIFRSTGRGGGAFEGPGGPSYLKPDTLTVAQMLKTKGYRTGVFGKWHVGLTWYDKDGERLDGGFENSLLIDYEKSTPLVDGPNARGFDESFITPNCPTTDPLYIYIENGMVPVPASQRHKRENLPNPGGKWRWDNDEGWMAPGYKFVDADLLFYEKTRDFIIDHVKRVPDKPFFAVLSTQIAHAPVLPDGEFAGKTKAGPRGDFVCELDALVGRVLDLLKSLNIDDNTLILFNSDNGAETVHVDWMRQDYHHDPSGGWRGVKRDGWEGGHRVPFIARWPARIPSGQVSDQLTNTTDIFATLASVAGYQLREKDATDSFDMLPAMLGTQDKSQSIRPHMLTQSFRGEFQIRQGPWKYLDHKGSGGNNYEQGILRKYALVEKAPEAAGQLYNLKDDPGETTNLFFKYEAKRKELQVLLRTLKESGRSAPKVRTPIGLEAVRSANR